MTKERVSKGRRGEQIAIEFLKNNGYCILERNYRNRIGEIDIIAQDDQTICFVEVRTRQTDHFGDGFESITPLKQQKISKVALSYLKSKSLLDGNARFDVIAIKQDVAGQVTVDIVKDAFNLPGPYAY